MVSLGIRFTACSRHLLQVAGLAAAMLVTALGQSEAPAAIINAASASLTDVQDAINSAADGDTVVVPAGTASWTSPLSINKGITLQGAGNDETVILDDVSRTPQNKGGAIMDVSLTSDQSFRLTGFTFRYGSLTTLAQNGGVRLRGTCSSTRIDHCHFDRTYQVDQIHTVGDIYGVIDHCVFDCRCPPQTLSILVWHDRWGGRANGDGSWNDLPYFGSERFLFIEDNTFNNLGGPQTNGNIDAKNGARYVARYNDFYNCMPNSHGTEGGPQTGVRAVEIYNNRFHWTFQSSGGQLRSGSAVIHNNTWDGVAVAHVMLLQQYRIHTNGPPLGPASGNNEWDLNDTEGNGTNVPGHKPFLYASGTASTSAELSLTVSPSPNWTTNKWVNYEIRNLDQQNPPPYPNSSYIISNTGDTIRFAPASQGTNLTFNSGNRFEIYKLLVSMDQPARGKRDLIRDSSGNPTGAPRWPHQVLEPVYAWNNNYVNGNEVSPLLIASAGPTLQENRDFYNNMPMPGYTPFTYPHPLVSGLLRMTKEKKGSSELTRDLNPWGPRKTVRGQSTEDRRRKMGREVKVQRSAIR